MGSGGFQPLDEKSLVEYIKATPSLSSQLGNPLDDLQIKEVGDGNLNFVFIVATPSASLVIKQGIYHCGYHSDKSYGAASYLIVHPEGNILVADNMAIMVSYSPRYMERLARTFIMMGGVHYMFLTHRDDIADHEKWSKRLNCYSCSSCEGC